MSGKLKFYSEKLAGYKKFYQIISTIKKIALSKFQTGIARTKTRDYTLRYSRKAFEGVFANEEENEMAAQLATIYITAGTNRGNCGPLNSAKSRYLQQIVDETEKANMQFLPIGKKGHESIPRLFPDQYTFSLINDDKQAKSLVWANYVLENADSLEGDADRIQIVWDRFASASSQIMSQYNLPSFEKFVEHLKQQSEVEATEGLNNYRFANAVLDMEEEDVKDFYHFHRALTVLNALSENELSEHAARIVAVEGQLTNIASLRDQTQMLFNKTRQGAITTALIEILSAMTAMADAQKGSGITKEQFW